MGKSQMFRQFKNALNDLNVRFVFENDRFDIGGVIVEFRKDEYGGYLLAEDPNNVTLGMFDSVNDRENLDPEFLAERLKNNQDFQDEWK